MSRDGVDVTAPPVSREQLMEELRWDTDVAAAVAAIKEQQSSADAHGGAAKQRGESFFGGTARRLSRGASRKSARGGTGADARSGRPLYSYCPVTVPLLSTPTTTSPTWRAISHCYPPLSHTNYTHPTTRTPHCKYPLQQLTLTPHTHLIRTPRIALLTNSPS